MTDDSAVEMAVQEVDATDKVLLVRASSVAHADELAPALARIAKRRKSAVLLVVGEVRLEALDDEAMAAAGWVRIAALEALGPAAQPEQLARVIAP